MKSINHKGRKDFRKGRKEMKNADLTLCTLCLLCVLVCLFFEIFYKVIDLLFYLTGNNDLCPRSIEPVTKFIMSAR